MSWILSALLAVVALAPVQPNEIEDYLREQQAELRIPGLAYVVVGPSGVISQGAWGVEADTPFLIGSVSKPVTAQAVMRLVEAGRVGLDDPVRRHVPWFDLADEDAAARITVRHLLTHTSGLGQWASRTDRFDNSADGLARSVRDLADVEPERAPGAAHEYSDANYMVLGALVETVSGKPYGEFLRSEIFEPLGMEHAAATEADAQRVGLPAGHRYWLGHPRGFDRGYDTSGSPYGYVAASLDDMARFARDHLGGRHSEMHKGQTANGYGLGWRDTEMDGTRVVWHAGATPGFFAHVVLLPDADVAVVVLANSYSLALDGSLAALGFNVARMTQGQAVQTSDTDPTFSVVLYVLLAVAALLVIGIARTLIRRRFRLLSAILWAAGCAVLIALVLVVLPAQLGGDLGMALLWTPDIGWAALVVAALAIILIAVICHKVVRRHVLKA
ncbi:serine hydrolase domain-containing protein [Paractinoplanes lichenicola]|uniref:Beta-lactamase family protein n=1 Tax=Paractinoplanes lichenicola TaxID=2802976 RepID=A0ABS1VLK5_9ACTN|nr:serine hydrolase domain-containing protein [Actinoplanes lichenicola]MBL7255609.1 beta-lactamase family protein [Actinoplanes lichenicola]